MLRREADEASLRSLAVRLQKKQKEVEKWEKAGADPRLLFKAEAGGEKPKYSQLDDRGVPTHDAAGKPLSDKARKAAEKAMEKAEAAFDEAQQKPEGFLSDLRRELSELTAEVAAVEIRLGIGCPP